MLYSYISKKEMKNILLNNGKAFVIKDVHTKDIEEYILSAFNIIDCTRFDKNKLRQTRVIKQGKDLYSILVIVKANAILTISEQQYMFNWLSMLGHVVTLRDYMNTESVVSKL